MPVAVEQAIVAPSQVPDSRHDEEGTHGGVLGTAECQMLSETRRAPTHGLGDQNHNEMRTTLM